MDYWTRIILSSIIGIGLGLGLGYFLGNYFTWIFIGLAIALATETALRTVRNVKAPPNPVLDKPGVTQTSDKKLAFRKPPKPKF